jgi:hypothetical protein
MVVLCWRLSLISLVVMPPGIEAGDHVSLVAAEPGRLMTMMSASLRRGYC